MDEARKIDAKELFEKANAFEHRWGFVKDGHYIVENPVNLILEGNWNKIPLMMGHTGNEFIEMSDAKTMEEFKDYAYKQYQEDAEEYLRLCKVDDNDVEKNAQERRCQHV